jgi:Predicted NAD/FAD-binding protein
MTYYLNKLQRLDEDEHYCVTLNRTAEIDPATDHPPLLLPPPARDPRVDARPARTAAPQRPAAHRLRRRWQGYCFHEDGLRSGLAAAAAFGASW